MASASESNRDRRERLRQLALETIDINKDPYFMKNHLGSYECKLCLTLHNNEVRFHMISCHIFRCLFNPPPRKKKITYFSCLRYRAAIWLTLKERSIRLTCKCSSHIRLQVHLFFMKSVIFACHRFSYICGLNASKLLFN